MRKTHRFPVPSCSFVQGNTGLRAYDLIVLFSYNVASGMHQFQLQSMCEALGDL
ncbi:hypothetical protein [Ktedonobacter sp. SOSP1-52]|uniref:hypothetical protein n=1 Tax=Ktedonobacter sp. SOSP1-52 TaxID=2778366 RepID=UPI0019154945|nr:hypothetical protein [Ktedonobacter sp. SOSP1-52]